MTISREYLLVVFFSLVCTIQIFAQSTQGQRGARGADPEQIAERQTKMMQDSLALSTAQTEKVSEVNLKYAKQMLEIRQAANRDFVAMKSQMEELRNNQNEELKQYLTDAQHADLMKIQEDRSNRRKEGRKGRKGDGPRSKKNANDE